MICDGKDYIKCKDEQQFKMLYCKKNFTDGKFFCIETEETVKGFPDVLRLTAGKVAHFLEFKYSDKNGKIKFQPTQPSFYKRHSDMDIKVIALNIKTMTVHEIPVDFLFMKDSKYCLNEMAVCNLSAVEDVLNEKWRNLNESINR